MSEAWKKLEKLLGANPDKALILRLAEDYGQEFGKSSYEEGIEWCLKIVDRHWKGMQPQSGKAALGQIKARQIAEEIRESRM